MSMPYFEAGMAGHVSTLARPCLAIAVSRRKGHALGVERDLFSRDVEVARVSAAWRWGLYGLRRKPVAELEGRAVSPFVGHEELLELGEDFSRASDELSRAIGGWCAALALERSFWSARVEIARARRTPRENPRLDVALSLGELFDVLLREPSPSRRERFAAALPELAAEPGELAVRLLLRRVEREEAAFLAVDGEPELAARLARRLLAGSDDLARVRPCGSLAHALRATLAADGEGWPARISPRWIASVFGDTRIGRGLTLREPALPPPLGAMSFARALGVFGAMLQEASRPRTLPFSLHLPVKSSRRRTRFALFASIITEPAFLTAVLGLGRDRALAERRGLAHALLTGLRIDCARVLVADAFLRGEAAGREAHAELGERVHGEPPPPEACGAIPELWPADAAGLVGVVRAAAEREALVERFDEDWFRNPRAIDSLRAADEQAAPSTTSAGLEAAADRLVAILEAAVG
jgi:hypothetical protein